MKTKDSLLKTEDILLKTKDSLLKTEDILLKTKDSSSVKRKLLTHILTNVPTYPHTQTSDLDNYNMLSLWLSLKIKTNLSNNNKQHGVNLRNLKQIPTSNRKNEHVIYKRIATVNKRSKQGRPIKKGNQ